MEWLIVFLVVVAIIVLTYFVVQISKKKDESILDLNNKLNTEIIASASFKNQYDNLASQQGKFISDIESERFKHSESMQQVARLEQTILNLEEQLQTLRLESVEKTDQLKNEFKVLANDILQSNSKEFSERLLLPIQDKIKGFEASIKDSFEKEMRDKISLREEMKKLYELNARMSDDANRLTSALKGDQKQQGNWGEFILESILEKSGLQKGSEYFAQGSYTDENGNKLLPDVVIKLPDNKEIVIDSKVSLTAFERYSNAEDKAEQENHLKDHLISFKSHIKALSQKEYQLIEDLNTPDFVLLFTPIESSFNLALKEDPELFQFAWEKNIVLVCPTTLLATLRTISSVWKQEKQTKNALKIAEESGKLYDSFVRFISSLEDIGKHINKSHDMYNEAMKKLSEGRGNLVTRVEKIKELGAKASRNIDQKYLDDYEN
jgi:DNA recombination protein RmuC